MHTISVANGAVRVPDATNPSIPARELGIGQIALMALGEAKPHCVVMAYNGLISLSNPLRTWSTPLGPSLRVCPLPRGAEFTYINP